MSLNSNANPFRRFAYSPIDELSLKSSDLIADVNDTNNLVTFAGGDLEAFINNIRVGNLEQLTISTSTEIVGSYVMGRRDPVAFTKGKRVIVGSMVLTQYDRHAFLEQVFMLSRRGIRTIGQLWASDSPAAIARDNVTASNVITAGAAVTQGVRQAATGVTPSVNLAPPSNDFLFNVNSNIMRGLNPTEFAAQQVDQLATAARLIGAQKFEYSDQIPPFDLTLIGVDKFGHAAKVSIFGMEISQETSGWSQNDLGSSVGLAFVAKGTAHFNAIDGNEAGAVGNGLNGL